MYLGYGSIIFVQINPLGHKSDQHQFSLNKYINAQSREKFVRIKKQMFSILRENTLIFYIHNHMQILPTDPHILP